MHVLTLAALLYIKSCTSGSLGVFSSFGASNGVMRKASNGDHTLPFTLQEPFLQSWREHFCAMDQGSSRLEEGPLVSHLMVMAWSVLMAPNCILVLLQSDVLDKLHYRLQ